MISFLSVFPPYRGGISTFSDYLYRHLDTQHTVNAFNFKRLYPSLLFPGRSQTTDSSAPPYAIPVLDSINPVNWHKTGHILARQQSGILLYSFWHPFFAPAYTYVLRKLKKAVPAVKRLGIIHNVLPHETFPLQKAITRRLFNNTEQLIFLSQTSVQDYHQLSVSTPYKKLFHPVYDQKKPEAPINSLRQKYGIGPHQTVFIFFGLVRGYKGLDIFIRALNRIDLDENAITPLIVGEFYIDKEPVLSLINPEQRKKYIIEDRFISSKEMAEYLYISDVMVMPYRTATQSGVLSNAINFNLPVITSDLPGLTEHIESGKNGLIVTSENVDDLTNAIRKMLDKKRRERMRENQRLLKKQLSWERFVDELEKGF